MFSNFDHRVIWCCLHIENISEVGTCFPHTVSAMWKAGSGRQYSWLAFKPSGSWIWPVSLSTTSRLVRWPKPVVNSNVVSAFFSTKANMLWISPWQVSFGTIHASFSAFKDIRAKVEASRGRPVQLVENPSCWLRALWSFCVRAPTLRGLHRWPGAHARHKTHSSGRSHARTPFGPTRSFLGCMRATRCANVVARGGGNPVPCEHTGIMAADTLVSCVKMGRPLELFWVGRFVVWTTHISENAPCVPAFRCIAWVFWWPRSENSSKSKNILPSLALSSIKINSDLLLLPVTFQHHHK